MPVNKQGMRYIIVILLNVCVMHIGAQNLSELCKQDPFKLSGGISTNHAYYGTTDTTSTRDPYVYTVTGNLNASIIGWSIPVSFSYSNNNATYQQPFNQYGIHPTYKWVTAHIGYSSMSFSPYSLSGEQFAGFGLELTPNSNFSLMAMYGRLRKAVDYKPDDEYNFPAYKRMGYGIKTEYTFKKVLFGFSIFKAKDDINSIYSKIPEEKDVKPRENLVLTANTGVRLFKFANLNFEYATSAYTDDLNKDESDGTMSDVFKHTGGLFKARTSTSYFDAYKSSLNLNFNFMNLGINYERVEPGYKTLGADYSNNDFENYTINFSTAFFRKRVTLSSNVGKQKNNLDDKKNRANERVVSSVNVGIAPIKNMNINMSYSNFTSFTKVKSLLDEEDNINNIAYVDTLGFTQISENANFNVAYRIRKSKNMAQSVSVNLAVQKASTKQKKRLSNNSGTTFYNIVGTYSMRYKPLGLTVNSSFNYNNNDAGEFKSSALGPNLSVGKQFFKKKLRTKLSSSYNFAYSQSELTNKNLSIRLNLGYILLKKHNFSLTSSLINRKLFRSDGDRKKTDYNVNFSYSYSF